MSELSDKPYWSGVSMKFYRDRVIDSDIKSHVRQKLIQTT